MEPPFSDVSRGKLRIPEVRTVEKIRVLVAARPRLMRELVIELISGQPDIEVMAEVQDDSKIAELVQELHPDCVIIGLDASDNRPDVCDSLFERHPHLKILALASERNSCIFYSATLNIRASRVETSERGILDALRGRHPLSASVLFSEGSKKIN
jgi:chemotaxis response regulator CheB